MGQSYAEGGGQMPRLPPPGCVPGGGQMPRFPPPGCVPGAGGKNLTS